MFVILLKVDKSLKVVSNFCDVLSEKRSPRTVSLDDTIQILSIVTTELIHKERNSVEIYKVCLSLMQRSSSRNLSI